MKTFPTLTDVKGVPNANDSSKVTLNIPAGTAPGAGRLLNLRILVSKGAAPATLAEIRNGVREISFNLGTETVQRCKVSELFMEQDHNGYTVENGIIDLFLAEPWRASVTDEEVLGVELRRYQAVSVEFDVVNDATPLSFQFDPEIDDRPKVDSAGQPILGMISKNVQIENVGGGVASVLLNVLNGPLQRVYIQYPSTATVSRVKLMQGDTVLYDRVQTTTKKGLTAQHKGMGMRIPSNFTDYAGTWSVWPIMFDNNQQLRNAILNPVGLKIELTIDTAATIRLLRLTQLAR